MLLGISNNTVRNEKQFREERSLRVIKIMKRAGRNEEHERVKLPSSDLTCNIGFDKKYKNEERFGENA